MKTKSADNFLNIAAVWAATHALGPGLRAAVWVQGCCFHCPGCVSPEWIPNVPAYQVSPRDLARNLLEASEFEGLTISGGEPILQAKGLAALIQEIRRERPVSVICFTGFTLHLLREHPANSSISKFLGEIDVLIDGPYISSLNDNQGLRGSSNQNVHYLTERLKAYDFNSGPRRLELHVEQSYTMMVGVPPVVLPESLEKWLGESSPEPKKADRRRKHNER